MSYFRHIFLNASVRALHTYTSTAEGCRKLFQMSLSFRKRAGSCMHGRQTDLGLTHIKRTPSLKATRKEGRKAFV